jgi:DNA-binding transcriptional regulator YiaG
MPRKSAPRSLWTRFTRAEIANFLSVSVATLNKWKRKKTLPEQFFEPLAVLTAARATKKPLQKALKASPETLARMAGVTVRTAKGWARKGEIPLKYHSAFYDVETAEKKEPKFRVKTEEKAFKGRISQGIMAKRSYPEEGTTLDTEEIVELSAWAESVKEPRFKMKARRDEKGRLIGTTYQLTAIVSSILGFDEKLDASPKAIEIVRVDPSNDLSDVAVKLAITSFAAANRGVAIDELIEKLQALADMHDVKILEAALFIRRPVNV